MDQKTIGLKKLSTSHFSLFSKIEGFSLVEIMIYTSILAIVGALFSGILFTVLRLQNRENASREVNQQLNFALNVIQRLTRESSFIEIATGTPATTLRLRAQNAAKDPTLISLSAGKISLQEGVSSPIDLTTNNVIVTNLSFLKISSFPGRDTVQIDVAMKYNTQNPQQEFAKTITSVVARATAATFDSDIVPGTDNTYDVGLGAARWQDLNLSGEIKIGGISGDGAGKTVCVKSDGNLGTCTTQPNGSGVCTCN